MRPEAVPLENEANYGAQGSDFFQTEYDRLDRMLSSGKVGGSRLNEISKKLSVLGSFLEEKYNDITAE